MKKLISAILTAALALPATLALPAQAVNSVWHEEFQMTSVLSQLNIMVGDDEGNYNFDSYVTRAEMAKIAVAASSYKNTVATGLAFSPFSDVKSSFWGSAYIQAAVSAGIVEGYIDGTFNPNGTVTYEEAITMMLKVLGYTNDDFGASYPYGQVGRATNLEMTDGVNSSIGEYLTRRQVATLVCNTLDTHIKDTSNNLISIHDCEIVEDVTIIASQSEDSTLSSDEINTTSGKYRLKGSFDNGYVGSKGDLIIKDGKYVLAFAPDGETTSEKYVIYSILDNAILAYPEGNNTNIKQFEISSTTTCYMNSTSFTYANLKSSMEMGDTIRIHYKDNGEIDYINYSEGTLEGPVKVTSTDWTNSFSTNSNTKIMRDGVKSSEGDIQINDILYYSAPLNMIMAYSKKITGVYESASPSKDSPQSVTISGVSYSIEGVEAFNDLSSSGDFNYGDTVTVLFGKDGEKIAGVTSNKISLSSTVTGYCTDTGRKTFTNSDGTTYTSYYVTMTTADGTSYTYPTTYSSSAIGKVIKAVVKNGNATVTVVSDNAGVSGTVSYANMTIGSKKVAADVKIIDTINNSTIPLYVKTFMQRLDGLTLSGGAIRYVGTNSAGEISELILLNTTNDMYSYGVVTNNISSSATGTKIDINSTIYEGSFNVSLGGAVQVLLSGNSIYNTTKIPSYTGSNTILTTSDATIDGKTYLLSDKVKVYQKIDTGNYQIISINDAISGGYNYTCYYDKAESSGGRIRIIICTK